MDSHYNTMPELQTSSHPVGCFLIRNTFLEMKNRYDVKEEVTEAVPGQGEAGGCTDGIIIQIHLCVRFITSLYRYLHESIKFESIRKHICRHFVE